MKHAAPVAATAPFGIYIHWPYCLSKCPYCDFNSHVGRDGDDHVWLVAFGAEIDRYAAELGPRPVGSVYFGGGTPSLMTARLVGGVLDRIAGRFRPLPDMEVTIEANPGAVDRVRFADFRKSGVNRASVGVQALNDADLRRLGRLHSAEDARRAIDSAVSEFPRMSFDLIYARQYQSLRSWETELQEALAFGTGHLSLYQLTIEDGTAFGNRKARGKLGGLPPEETCARMYEVTQELCEAHGLPAYEVSNHARAAHRSRHNSIYWACGDWIGIGPGAHGRIASEGRRWATETARLPADWLAAVAAGNGESLRTELSSDAQATEYLLMGMRRAEGVSLARLGALTGRMPAASDWADLADWGLLWLDGDRLKTTPRGRLLLNAVLRQLVQSLVG